MSVGRDVPVGVGWFLSLYPGAAEAGGTFVPTQMARYRGVRGLADDPGRSRVEAARRAGSRLRRYCAANGLNRLGTLTYAPPFCTDPAQVRADVAGFFRNLRADLGNGAFPYAWVPELHADGRRFHVHFGVGHFVPRRAIERAWGKGFVHIKLLGDLPVGSGTLGEARMAARYLSKYVTKAIGEDAGRRPFGRHRYEVAQGFVPQVIRLRGVSACGVLDAATAHMGCEPSLLWNSDEISDWHGAPAVWAQWNV